MKLPKVESLIITVFFLCIGLWAVSKCASKRSQIVRNVRESLEEESEDRPAKRDTVFVPQPQPQSQPATTPAPQTYSAPPATGGGVPKLQQTPPASTPPATTPTTQPAVKNQPAGGQPASTGAAAPKYSTLFVTIDGLKVRKAPNLKSDVVTKLKLDEQVYFLNKKSEKQEEINLGYETVTDYWVKIRTKSGKEGWVFGAGVHYYKMKRKGVIE